MPVLILLISILAPFDEVHASAYFLNERRGVLSSELYANG